MGDDHGWPEPRPTAATWVDLPGLAGHWVVPALPPEPFLTDLAFTRDGPWPVAQYGPPGTVWVFGAGEIAERLLGVNPPPGSGKLLNRLLRKFARYSGGGSLAGFSIPTSVLELPVQFVRTQIVQAVGTIEQAVHVVNWIPIGGDAGTLDPAALKSFGDGVRDSWQLFLDADVRGNPGGGGSSGPYRKMMAAEARYSEVRTSVVNQAGPGKWVEYGAGATQIQHPGADQNQVGQTAISPFDPAQGSAQPGAGASLPYEVALCVGLNTNFRGPRFRGRLYLGPLSVFPLGSAGLFNPLTSLDVANQLGLFLDRVNQGGALKASVISYKYATAAPIQGTRAGSVPDSQRRRRRGQAENFVQAWGTPIGGAV